MIIPEEIIVEPKGKVMIDHKVSCSFDYDGGYYLYPRSSLATKTTLIMANSVGIIDKEYRGTIKAVVYNISDIPFVILKGSIYFQLCLPSLKPFSFRIEKTLDETERGSNGFGSTGNILS